MCGVPPIRSCSRGRRLLLWARGRARPTARRWRECWAASLRRRVSSSSAVLRVGWTARLTVARSRRTVTWVADDRLIGGPGNDRLHGNAGDDRYACGAGRDVVYADEGETVSGSCEVVHRQPASPPPALSPPGHYAAPGEFLSFDVNPDGRTVWNFFVRLLIHCQPSTLRLSLPLTVLLSTSIQEDKSFAHVPGGIQGARGRHRQARRRRQRGGRRDRRVSARTSERRTTSVRARCPGRRLGANRAERRSRPPTSSGRSCGSSRSG